MQIGSNAGQTLAVALTKADSSSLGIAGVDLINGASNAITSFDSAISSVSGVRATFGALQNRLEHALNVSNNYHENLTSSESRIRDSDMASEMMAFTKNNILSQASLAMLTQANQQPQNLLQLSRTSA
jgi:flagellin